MFISSVLPTNDLPFQGWVTLASEPFNSVATSPGLVPGWCWPDLDSERLRAQETTE